MCHERLAFGYGNVVSVCRCGHRVGGFVIPFSAGRGVERRFGKRRHVGCQVQALAQFGGLSLGQNSPIRGTGLQIVGRPMHQATQGVQNLR